MRFPRSRRAVLLLAAALASPAASEALAPIPPVAPVTRVIAAARVPVRLLAPGDGTVLEAGGRATLDWAPLAELARPGGWEEWEAFLSLDGGLTYSVRLTPHLDRALHRFSFAVPDLPSRDVRLLLRLGDERHERAIELPQRFTIAQRSPRRLGQSRISSLTLHAWHRGEPARAGDAGVLTWVEGPRDGGSSRPVAAVESERLSAGFSLPSEAGSPAMAPSGSPPSGAPSIRQEPLTAFPPPAQAVIERTACAPPKALDLLLLLKRRNE
ncbi:MAG TPA: hypothetical protein VMM92_07810 [Thermoanaerobaculia bacterium]|nr:hypothetical protein [Thermoanaerobaculia bacterium]